jgi:hypothetical protein
MRRLALAAALVLAACGSDPQAPDQPDPDPPPVPAPEEGILRVRADTAGLWPQTDQYAILLDGAETRSFVTPGSAVGKQVAVAPGTYTVSLGGLPAWCSAADAPRTVEVPAESVVDVTFRVTCTAARVTILTLGEVPDPDGYQLVSGDTVLATTTTPDAALTIALAPGRRTVSLRGVAPHCRPERTSWEWDVTPTGFSPLLINVTCTGALLRAEIATTGSDIDLGGYEVVLTPSDPAQPGITSLRALGTSSFPIMWLSTGATWTATLSDLAPNCRADEPTRAGTVAGTDTVTIPFSVVCTPLPEPGILVSVGAETGFGFYTAADRLLASIAAPLHLGFLGDAEWSRDGRTMAFVGNDDDAQISVLPRDGAERRRLGLGTQPVFTPDGAAVLFIANGSNGSWPQTIVRASVAGGATSVVRTEPQGILGFDLSPDGGRIALVRWTVAGSTELVLVNADGTGAQVLAADATASRPRFSPDGTEILAEVRGAAGTPDRWFALRTDGSGRRQLGQGSAAAWSPDGSRVALGERAPDGGGTVVTVRSSDGGDRRVVGQTTVRLPVVSISWR